MRAYTGIDELDGDRFTASRGQAHIKDIDESYGPIACCGNLSTTPALFRKPDANVSSYCVPCQDAYAERHGGKGAQSATDSL